MRDVCEYLNSFKQIRNCLFLIMEPSNKKLSSYDFCEKALEKNRNEEIVFFQSWLHDEAQVRNLVILTIRNRNFPEYVQIYLY